jgi:hypothetical protein
MMNDRIEHTEHRRAEAARVPVAWAGPSIPASPRPTAPTPAAAGSRP